MEEEALKIPNLTHPETPSPGNEKLISLHSTPPKFDFAFKDHLDLGKEMDLIDFESGAITSGEKFYYLKNEAALLEIALVNWSMDRAIKRGYAPILAPDLIRPEIAHGCGFQPRTTAR
jgi:seryl-tRNA synthetase